MLMLEECTDLDIIDSISDEGKALEINSKEDGSINEAILDAYRLQKTTYTCGVASCCIVLQALKGKVYEEAVMVQKTIDADVLDEDYFSMHGLTMPQLEQIIKLHSAHIKVIYSSESNVEGFKEDLKRVFKKGNNKEAIIANFSSRHLFPKCKYTGHFSPIAAYEQDMVMVADVGKKYRPYWVPVEDMYASMQGIDGDSGMSRGYGVVSIK